MLLCCSTSGFLLAEEANHGAGRFCGGACAAADGGQELRAEPELLLGNNAESADDKSTAHQFCRAVLVPHLLGRGGWGGGFGLGNSSSRHDSFLLIYM